MPPDGGHARALVLGGGGITGIAWEIGLLAGLAERGLDLADADMVVGTSAGSVVAALLLRGTPLEDLYAAQLAGSADTVGARLGPLFYLRWVSAALWPGDARRGRARIGRAALRASAPPESEWRRVFEDLLDGASWPERRLLITAVEATTGEPRVFDRESGASLAEAVAASCAVPLVWPPVTIQGRRYVDGGVWSPTNTQLAAGCDRVVVVAPLAHGLRRPQRISFQLRRLGPGVLSTVIRPQRAGRREVVRDVLNPERRAAAARLGRAQAAAVAERVASVWEQRERGRAS